MQLTRSLISIDPGTTRLRVFVPSRGLIADEHNVASIAKNGSATAIGEQALLKKARKTQRLVWPFEQGVVSQFEAQAAIFKYWIAQSLPRVQLVKPDVIIAFNGVATASQLRALLECVPPTQVRKVYPISAVLAAALGSGLPIDAPKGHMVIHCGGGSTDIALFSLGEIIHQKSLRIGGQDITNALQKGLVRHQAAHVDLQDVEQLKVSELSLIAPKRRYAVPGADMRTGRKKMVNVSGETLIASIDPVIDRVIVAAKQVLQAATPALVGDVAHKGIILTGGTAQLHGWSTYLSRKLHANCVSAVEPSLSVVRGINYGSTYLRDYQRLAQD